MKNNNILEEKIITIAKRLFIERGFDGTSMSDIAAAADINRPTLHYYFRTKDKMFQAVFQSIVSIVSPSLQKIFTEEGPFFDKIEKVIDVYISVFSENPALPNFILSEANRDIDHLILTVKTLPLAEYINRAEQMIQKEMKEGRLKEVPISTLFLTLYSMLIFPFLSKKVLSCMFFENEEEFRIFLLGWKQNICNQMKALLEVTPPER